MNTIFIFLLAVILAMAIEHIRFELDEKRLKAKISKSEIDTVHTVLLAKDSSVTCPVAIYTSAGIFETDQRDLMSRIDSFKLNKKVCVSYVTVGYRNFIVGIDQA